MGHFAMAEDAYGTGWQVAHSTVEPQQQPVQPPLRKQKWVVVVVLESPTAAKGWKGRRRDVCSRLGHRVSPFVRS